MAIEIPESLRKLATDAVTSIIHQSLPLPDLKPLQDWFEDEGWDEVVMSVQGSCVYVENFAADYFNDDSVREHSDSDDVDITDTMRIQFGRMFIDSRLEQSEDSVHAVELKVSPLPSVYLDCMVIGQGQGGWLLEWGTAYASVQELLDSYEGTAVGDSTSLSDEKILELWQKDES
jgi:hypothetical protein